MKSIKLTKQEMETIISFNEEDKAAHVYTHNRALMRRLDKLLEARPESVTLERVLRNGAAAEYYFPKAWLRVNAPRIASPAMLEAMSKAREAQKSILSADNAL